MNSGRCAQTLPKRPGTQATQGATREWVQRELLRLSESACSLSGQPGGAPYDTLYGVAVRVSSSIAAGAALAHAGTA